MIKYFLYIAVLFFYSIELKSQSYIFQDTRLDDDERIENLISHLTIDEKIDYLASRTPGINRLGIKPTRLMEGLHGLAHSGVANWSIQGDGAAPTTTFPQSYGLAQMWDPELLEDIAAWEAYECRFLSQNKNYGRAGLVILAPNADLGRDIRWGRTEECYGEDAYLGAKMTEAFVKGLQGDHPKYWKTASLMKHFLANSNENERFITSSDFDERLFREYYGYTFKKGIEAGSRAYMAAYNKINGIPGAVHPILKNVTVNEWGQNGIICTDGGAFKLLVDAHKYFDSYEQAAAACLEAGINVFLDDYKPYLRNAIKLNLVSEKEIDEALVGVFRVMLKLGYLDNSSENPYSQIGIADTSKPWESMEASELARKATRKSIVLLKNDNSLLPLDYTNIKSIAVIGPSADLVVPDWYTGNPPYKISILDGINNAVSAKIKINYAKSNKSDSALIAAKNSDVAIVCIGNHPLSYGLEWGENYVYSDGREAVDRQALSLEQEDLVKLVKSVNPNTILILVSSFPYAINWSKENIPSILHVTHSSQELGNGIADIVFGSESPAGRLVQTWSSSLVDLLPILEYDITKGRTYMYDKHKPLYEFGYGLSYTEFEYSDIKVEQDFTSNDKTINVSFNVENIGEYDSDEVSQIYVKYLNSNVARPMKELKGFKRFHIKKGSEKRITIPINKSDLAYWDEKKKKFIIENCKIKIAVGSSSKDIRLTSQYDLTN